MSEKIEGYELCTWERNGYDDSDFYLQYWPLDPSATAPVTVETHSTRFSGGMDTTGIRPLTPEIALKAREWLQHAIYDVIRQAEHADVLTPQIAYNGDSLTLTRKIRHKGTSYPAGLIGEVFWIGAYGQFYRTGYNKPGRENRRVGLRLADGSRIFVALSACRRTREPMSDAELMQRAENLSWEGQSSAIGGCRAWTSTNQLTPMLKSLRPIKPEQTESAA